MGVPHLPDHEQQPAERRRGPIDGEERACDREGLGGRLAGVEASAAVRAHVHPGADRRRCRDTATLISDTARLCPNETETETEEFEKKVMALTLVGGQMAGPEARLAGEVVLIVVACLNRWVVRRDAVVERVVHRLGDPAGDHRVPDV